MSDSPHLIIIEDDEKAVRWAKQEFQRYTTFRQSEDNRETGTHQTFEQNDRLVDQIQGDLVLILDLEIPFSCDLQSLAPSTASKQDVATMNNAPGIHFALRAARNNNIAFLYVVICTHHAGLIDSVKRLIDATVTEVNPRCVCHVSAWQSIVQAYNWRDKTNLWREWMENLGREVLDLRGGRLQIQSAFRDFTHSVDFFAPSDGEPSADRGPHECSDWTCDDTERVDSLRRFVAGSKSLFKLLESPNLETKCDLWHLCCAKSVTRYANGLHWILIAAAAGAPDDIYEPANARDVHKWVHIFNDINPADILYALAALRRRKWEFVSFENTHEGFEIRVRSARKSDSKSQDYSISVNAFYLDTDAGSTRELTQYLRAGCRHFAAVRTNFETSETSMAEPSLDIRWDLVLGFKEKTLNGNHPASR